MDETTTPPGDPAGWILVVTGGRDFEDGDRLSRALSHYLHLDPARRVHMVIAGGATGADALAMAWAALPGVCVPSLSVPADWERDGRSAGPRRNRRMLRLALDLRRLFRRDPVPGHLDGLPTVVLIAFPGGPGTRSCIDVARTYGIEVVEV